MQKWEYLTVLVDSKVDTSQVRKDDLGRKTFQFNPIGLLPVLNPLGADGWELISAHPYSVGENDDVLTHQAIKIFTHTYLCVFKRPVEALF